MSGSGAAGGAGVFAEGHVVQLAQAVVWATAAIVALWASRRRPPGPDRAVVTWQGLLAALALARELDLHEALHAVTPIHFRTRWLLDPAAPLGWKIAVVGLGLAVAAAVLGPPWRLARQGRWPFRARDRQTWLIAASLGALLAGYGLDDLVSRRSRWPSAKAFEETLELVGAVLFWAAVEHERAWPLSARQGARPARTPAAGR